MSFKPIETQRLIIRKFSPSDFTSLYEYLSDVNAVTLKDGNAGRLIGNLYLGKRPFDTMELGFVFDTRWQMHGYATEAATALLDYAFDALKAHRVIAECNPLNYRSHKLMERLGMRREAEFNKNVYFKKDSFGNPIWQDTLQYAILSAEWRKEE